MPVITIEGGHFAAFMRPRRRAVWRCLPRIDAPYKRLIWFEESAHNPPFEEPDLFNRTLVDAVKPFVTPGVKSEP